MQSHVSAEIPFTEGNESDFKELREAIKSGKAQKNEYVAGDSSEESDQEEKALQTGFFPKPNENDSDVEEEDDDTEPDDPGLKLLWAAQHDNTDLIQNLLKTNPDLVKFADSDGYTALHRAAYSGSHMSLKILLRSGADITAITEDGWIPLHSACRWNKTGCIETLLSWGSDVNKQTTGGQTPLHLAAVHPNAFESLQVLLIQPKLKAMTENCQGDTPLDIAKRNGNPTELFQLMLPCFSNDMC